MSIAHTIAKPYKGLAPFSESDANIFFGREQECEVVAANLLTSRFTVVYGASGVGKSSLLRAGVVHYLSTLAQKRLQSSTEERNTPEFIVIVFDRWSGNLVGGLSEQIRQVLSPFVQSYDLGFQPNDSIPDLVDKWKQATRSTLLVILDQFESYLAYHPEVDEFTTQLSDAIRTEGLGINFLISIREDSLAKLDRFEGYIPNLFDNNIRINRLGRTPAKEAIENPIRKFNEINKTEIRIEPELVETVLNEVTAGKIMGVVEGSRFSISSKDEVDAPYLQLVMERLWKTEIEAGSDVLRLKTLHEVGYAESIVRKHLDDKMEELDTPEQNIAAQIFRYLVTPSRAKVAYSASDLAAYTNLKKNEITLVLEKLSSTDSRIVRLLSPLSNQHPAIRYEIFHDALSAAVLDWRARFVQKQNAYIQKQRSIAFARELAANSISQMQQDQDLSVLLALEALRIEEIPQAYSALRLAVVRSYMRYIIRDHLRPVKCVAYSPDGQYLLTASDDCTARIWTARYRPVNLMQHESPVLGAVYSPDSKFILTFSSKRAFVWTNKGNLSHELKGHSEDITCATFSADGQFVATSSKDMTARVWTTKVGTPIAQMVGHSRSVNCITFNPDDEFVATGSDDGMVKIWEASSGKLRTELRGHEGPVDHISYYPKGIADNELLLTSGQDNIARVWNTRSGLCLQALRGHTGIITSSLFNNDGTRILTASEDGTVRIWDTHMGMLLAVLRGHTDPVLDVLFTPDGKFIITTSGDETSRVWDAIIGDCILVLRGHRGAVRTATVSGKGNIIVTGGEDAKVRIWQSHLMRAPLELRGYEDQLLGISFGHDNNCVVAFGTNAIARTWEVTSGKSRLVLDGHESRLRSVSFSYHNNQILTSSDDGTARLWSATTGQSLGTLRGHLGSVYNALFSPDDRLIVTSGVDKTVRIWDLDKKDLNSQILVQGDNISCLSISHNGKFLAVARGNQSAVVEIWNLVGRRCTAKLSGHNLTIYGVNFSYNDEYLVTASDDSKVCVWDVSTGKCLKNLSTHKSWVRQAIFSPDNKYIATAGGDNTAKIWDAETGQVTVDVLHAAPVNTVAFSPNGQLVVSASLDNTVKLWDVLYGWLLEEFHGHTKPVQCVAFSPDGNYVATASLDGIGRLYSIKEYQPEQIRTLAREKISRNKKELTPAERRRYLHDWVT